MLFFAKIRQENAAPVKKVSLITIKLARYLSILDEARAVPLG